MLKPFDTETRKTGRRSVPARLPVLRVYPPPGPPVSFASDCPYELFVEFSPAHGTAWTVG